MNIFLQRTGVFVSFLTKNFLNKIMYLAHIFSPFNLTVKLNRVCTLKLALKFNGQGGTARKLSDYFFKTKSIYLIIFGQVVVACVLMLNAIFNDYFYLSNFYVIKNMFQ